MEVFYLETCKNYSFKKTGGMYWKFY